ncbi:MAG: hypothetical protein KAS23_05425 [Anaerohalosphaera sp.]|nr:hypothetical protein [Anaerohalosphaera sp.]
MKTMCLYFVLVGISICSPLSLAAVAVEIEPGIRWSGSPFSLGYTFTVDTEIRITDLGKFDADGGGMAADAIARLYNWDTGAAIVSATIPVSSPAENTGGVNSHFAAIDPATLSPGTTYLLAVEVGDADFYFNTVGVWGGQINWGSGKATPTDNPTMPTTANTTTFSSDRTTPQCHFGPNFKFEIVMNVTQPQRRAVFQRNDQDIAIVPVQGTFTDSLSRIEARAVLMDGFSGTNTDWHVIEDNVSGGAFSGTLEVPAGGWYSIEVRSFDGEAAGPTARVDKVGVGEVFITAGQSNSANSGSPPLTPTHDTVSAWTGSSWRHAYDPQPIATGSGGSPWSRLGDILAEEFDVPIGFASVGWGGTRVDQWLPGGSLYPRLEAAINTVGATSGMRAILWHQGESDSIANTTSAVYASRLNSVISQSRIDAGWDVPWGVALASFHPNSSTVQEARVRAGQELVIAGDSNVFEGADTDDFHLLGYLSDSVHFNNTGLYEHALGWKQAVVKLISAPRFIIDPIVRSDAVEGYDYSGTLSGQAAPKVGTTVTYSRAAGGRWLDVAADGTLSGVPGDMDTGVNSFSVRATDESGVWGEAELEITVHNTFTGELGMFDLAGLAAGWLDSECADVPACGGADLTGDSKVDIDDVMAFAGKWLVDYDERWLFSHWPFDDDGSDMAGENDAVLFNGAHITSVAGEFKVGTGAITFDGINDHATANGICANIAGRDVTIAMWVKAGPASFNKFFAAFNNADGSVNRLLFGQEGGSSILSVYDNGWQHSGVSVFDQVWHHVAFVLSDSTDEGIVYVDGEFVHSYATETSIAGDDLFSLGQEYDAGLTMGDFFGGQLDDVKVYGLRLTANEIKALGQL